MKRATNRYVCKSCSVRDFNPRPREEGDLAELIDELGEQISIHALVKRATLKMLFLTVFTKDFNPRPREEGDKFTRCFTSGIK